MDDKILKYYTSQNLTKITRKIIEAYRNKKYSYILGLGKIADENLAKKYKNVQKIFARLIMLYHPDRLNLYLKEINELKHNKKAEELKKFGRIVDVLENLDTISNQALTSDFEVDIEYEYGYDEEDFDSVDVTDEFIDYNDDDFSDYEPDDFESLIKQKEQIDINDTLPSFYLEQLEGELSLSGSNLYDLSGIENCTNITTLDLSKNQLIDITQIGFLRHLEEINLSENNINSIDIFENLTALKIIDISFNDLEDISSIFKLPELKYVNLIGNNIPDNQIEIIKQKGVIVIY